MHCHAEQLGLGRFAWLVLGATTRTRHGGEFIRKRASLHVNLLGLTVAHQAHLHRIPGTLVSQRALEFLGGLDPRAVDRGDDVGQLQVGVFRRATRHELTHDHAVLNPHGEIAKVRVLTQRGDADAEPGAGDLAVLDQHVCHALGQVHRHGKPDPGVHTADERVDTDDLSVDIHQRPAAVAGVDAGIGLDEVLVEHELVGEHAATLRADVPNGDAVVQLERRADRDGKFAGLGLRRVAQLGRSQAGCIDLYHTDIRLAIHPEHFAVEFPAVLKHDLHLVRPLDDVAVGHDDAVLAVDQPGALPVKNRLTGTGTRRRLPTLRLLEKFPEILR